jgi:hypothetical protein
MLGSNQLPDLSGRYAIQVHLYLILTTCSAKRMDWRLAIHLRQVAAISFKTTKITAISARNRTVKPVVQAVTTPSSCTSLCANVLLVPQVPSLGITVNVQSHK